MSSSGSVDRAPAPAVRPVPGADDADHLIDGWEPHREVADGLVRRFVFAYASSIAAPVAALGGTVVRRNGFVLHDLGRPAGYYNGVTLLRPLPYAGWQDVFAHGCHVFALRVTLPTHRGRGAWQAMVHRRLAAFPDLPALSLFSDMSRPPAEGIGFLPLSRWTAWSLPRGA